MKMLHSELLPPALLLRMQLEGKGMAVHWVDMQRSDTGTGNITATCRPVARRFDGTILGLIHIEVHGSGYIIFKEPP